MTFKNIRAGDRVRFRIAAGVGRNGVQWKEVSGKVNPLLIFESHVVVNHGNNGAVVDITNYISHRSTGRAA